MYNSVREITVPSLVNRNVGIYVTFLYVFSFFIKCWEHVLCFTNRSSFRMTRTAPTLEEGNNTSIIVYVQRTFFYLHHFSFWNLKWVEIQRKNSNATLFRFCTKRRKSPKNINVCNIKMKIKDIKPEMNKLISINICD